MPAEIDVQVTLGGVMAYNVDQSMTSAPIVSAPCRLLGWSLVETSGAAAAAVEFHSAQTRVGEATMAASTADTEGMPNPGVECPQGISLTAVSGAFKGCVYVAIYL